MKGRVFDATSFQKNILSSGVFFAVKRGAIFILGGEWKRLCQSIDTASYGFFFNGGGNVLVEVEHIVEEVVHGLEATEVVCHLCHPVVAVEIRFVEVGYHDVFLHLQVFRHGI